MFGRLKDWRKVAIGYDRCPKVFLLAIALAAVVIYCLWIVIPWKPPLSAGGRQNEHTSISLQRNALRIILLLLLLCAKFSLLTWTTHFSRAICFLRVFGLPLARIGAVHFDLHLRCQKAKRL